jgi:hypothetical protein
MENKTLDKTILEHLKNTDENSVIQALESIQDKGNVDYIPHILMCYQQSQSSDVKKRITNLLNDIKDKKSAPIIVDLIKQSTSDDVTSMLLTSCWSSGIDYSQYLPVFIDLVISRDYMTAFEALTVIDNIEGNFDVDELNGYIEKVKQASITDPSQKKRAMYIELISVLERLC